MKKKILSVALLTGAVLSLASCGKKTTYNQIVPYGSLSDTNIYATSNGNSISEKSLYDLMKKNGYTNLTNSIKEQLFSDITSNTKYFDYSSEEDRYQINSSVINDIYGVNTVSNFKKLSDSDKDTAIQKFVDKKFNAGLTKADGTYYTVNDVKSYAITYKTYEGQEVFEAEFPKDFYENYIYDIAIKKYALEQIKNPDSKYYYKNKYISGSGKNPYYVSEDDVIEYYYNSGKTYGENKGIIIKFASEAQAIRVMKAVNGGSTTISSNKDEALSAYINIYNQRYVTRDSLTINNYLDDFNVDLSVTSKVNKLSSYSSNVETMFNNMKDGEYLNTYFNVDGSYYLIYRISGFEEVEWENLPDVEKKPSESGNTIYDKMLEMVLETKNTSTLQTEIANDRYEELYESESLKIYDPVLSQTYEDNNKDDYSISNYSSDTLVYEFSYNDKTFSLSVDDFYKELEKESGMSTAISYLTNEYVLGLSKMVEKIDEDEVSDYESSIKSDLKSFKKGKTSYSSKIGETTYLQLKYGYNTVEEVVKAYKAGLVKTEMLSYYGNFEGVSGTFNTDSELFKNFADIYKKLYDSYFSATLSHILIGIDEEGSGSYTDPDIYKANLITEELRTKFDNCMLDVINIIIKEVKVLTISKDVKDALTYIVEAFNNNYEITSLTYESGVTVTWEDVKNEYSEFPLSLKAEDLGEISASNASSYVSAFSKRAKELYQKVIDGDILESDMEDKGVFEFESVLTDLSGVCKTNYGYHILNIYETGELTSAKFESSSDSKANDTDEYKQYEHIKVVITPDGDDDDEEPDYVLYTNGYSSSEYASVNQLFVYFFEYTNSGSVSGLKSSVKTAISKIFDSMISQYTNTSFKDWRILKYQLDIKFTNDTNDQKINEYISIKERELFSYTTSEFTQYQDWITDYNWYVNFN